MSNKSRKIARDAIAGLLLGFAPVASAVGQEVPRPGETHESQAAEILASPVVAP